MRIGTNCLRCRIYIVLSTIGLPVPKLTTANQELTEDDLEDIVKPKDAELALREKPPPLISQQRIKIVIPSLPAVRRKSFIHSTVLFLFIIFHILYLCTSLCVNLHI